MQVGTFDSKAWLETHRERQQQIVNNFIQQTLGETNAKKGPLGLVNSSQDTEGRDSFIKSPENEAVFVNGTDGKPALRYQGEYLTESLMDMVNNSVFMSRRGDLIFCNGIAFDRNQIPSMADKTFNQVKAKDNVVDFGGHSYFTYISPDGEKHNLYAADYIIGEIRTEELRGAPYDEQLQRYAQFWNYLLKSNDGIYIGMEFSDEEIKGYLSEMGIEPGFFTIKVGNMEKEYYYTTHEYSCPVLAKWRYDEQYKGLTDCSHGPVTFFRDLPPDTIVEGREGNYTINEKGGLNIPYGADVWDLKWTPVIPETEEEAAEILARRKLRWG